MYVFEGAANAQNRPIDLEARDVARRFPVQRQFADELGALVGLKRPAVHQRIKRLEERGSIIGYGAKIDYARLGSASSRS